MCIYKTLSHLSHLTIKSQVSTIDVLQSFNEIESVKEIYKLLRCEIEQKFHIIYEHVVPIGEKANVQSNISKCAFWQKQTGWSWKLLLEKYCHPITWQCIRRVRWTLFKKCLNSVFLFNLSCPFNIRSNWLQVLWGIDCKCLLIWRWSPGPWAIWPRIFPLENLLGKEKGKYSRYYCLDIKSLKQNMFPNIYVLLLVTLS